MTIEQKAVRKITNKEASEWVLNRMKYLDTTMKDVFTIMRILRANLILVDINENDGCLSNDVEDAISEVRKEKRKENKGKNKRGSKRKNRDYWRAC